MPKYEDREPLLRSFVGNLHSISNEEFQQLVTQTQHLSISGLKTHVQSVKDAIEDKVRNATHFVMVNTETSPKWIPCLPSVRGSVQQDKVNLENIACPKLRFKDLSLQSDKVTKHKIHNSSSSSYLERMQLTQQELDKLSGVKNETDYDDSMYTDYKKKYKCYDS